MLDASTAEFSLSSFTDDACRTQLETLIRQLKPKELIHQKGNLSVSTIRLLRNCLGLECQWTALKEGKEFLAAEVARDELVKLFQQGLRGGEAVMDVTGDDEDAVVPKNVRAMYDKPVAMSALGGMVWCVPLPGAQPGSQLLTRPPSSHRYLRQLNLDLDLVTTRNFNVYDPLSKSDGTLHLDGQTLAHIEVLQNSQGTTEGTLIQLLSRCVTPFGKRLFKVWLCAPLRGVSAINDRCARSPASAPSRRLRADALPRPCLQPRRRRGPPRQRYVRDVVRRHGQEAARPRAHAEPHPRQDVPQVRLPQGHRGASSPARPASWARQLILSCHSHATQSFEDVDVKLKTLADLAEDFKSSGIRKLLSSAPDVADLLEEIKELYDGEGASDLLFVLSS